VVGGNYYASVGETFDAPLYSQSWCSQDVAGLYNHYIQTSPAQISRLLCSILLEIARLNSKILPTGCVKLALICRYGKCEELHSKKAMNRSRLSVRTLEFW
jgi:hypothetical protein